MTGLASRGIPYAVEIVHYLMDNDSVGDAVCQRADALDAAAVVLAKHQRGRISEFFLGRCEWGCALKCTGTPLCLAWHSLLLVNARSAPTFNTSPSRIQPPLLRSVTKHVTHECKKPVVVLHE